MNSQHLWMIVDIIVSGVKTLCIEEEEKNIPRAFFKRGHTNYPTQITVQ
jgi:hypothetical protein